MCNDSKWALGFISRRLTLLRVHLDRVGSELTGASTLTCGWTCAKALQMKQIYQINHANHLTWIYGLMLTPLHWFSDSTQGKFQDSNSMTMLLAR